MDYLESHALQNTHTQRLIMFIQTPAEHTADTTQQHKKKILRQTIFKYLLWGKSYNPVQTKNEVNLPLNKILRL